MDRPGHEESVMDIEFFRDSHKVSDPAGRLKILQKILAMQFLY